MTSTSYFEILNRALQQNPSLLNYTTDEDIEIFETTRDGTYFDVYCETEGQPSFVVHCYRSVSDFSSDIEWL